MRSLSEVMLRHSVNLMQQAIASLHAQELDQRLDHASVPFRGMDSNEDTSWGKEQILIAKLHASESPENTVHSPQRHIRFDDKVGQCVTTYRSWATECETCYSSAPDNGDPRDDAIIIKTTEDRAQCTSDGSNQMIREFAGKNNQAIEALAPTLHRYGGDSAQRTPWESNSQHFRGLAAEHHSHQRATTPKHIQMYLDEDEEDIDIGWLPSTVSPPTVRQNRVTAHRYRTSDSALDNDMDSVTVAAARATVRKKQPTQSPSQPATHWDGEGEDVTGEDDKIPGGNGLYGRLVHAVNTMRDIAVVLWHGGTS